MKRPLIAISARNQTANPDNPIRSDNSSYFEYVSAGGGLPCIVFVTDEAEADQIADTFDGLLLSGGEDCDPALYGEENTKSEVIDSDIEHSDILLYKAFQKAGKPVWESAVAFRSSLYVKAQSSFRTSRMNSTFSMHRIRWIPHLAKTRHATM